MNSIFHWKAGGLVEAAQQFLGNNPLEILFLAFDAISRAPVCLYRQQCKDGIDVTQLDNTPALRSVMLVVDMVVDMINVLHRIPRLKNGSEPRFFRLFNGRESAGNDAAAASFQRTGCQGCRISLPDLAMV